jgi:SpoU rRNA methylase family enzyme
MRCTDTDSKGKIIFQTNSGVYVPMTLEECREAVKVLEEAITYVENDNPRKQIDARKY